jgi:succinate dehydrogenase/fumarate reductase flavoprotein subunit
MLLPEKQVLINSKEAYIDEVIRVGKGLSRSAAVKQAAEEAESVLESLEIHGVEFDKSSNSFAVRPLRNEAGIREGIHQLAVVESDLEKTVPSDINERKIELDLRSEVLVLKAILSASLERRESRGAFQREDFPETDDTNWKKNTRLAYDPEGNRFSISHHSIA